MRRRQLLLSGAAAVITACAGAAAPTPRIPKSYPAHLAANPSLGVWPANYRAAPKIVQTAYQFAAGHEDVLRYIPCYCGCVSDGHTSNHDCFVAEAKPDGWVILDPHGLGCGTCVGITLEVIAMRERGIALRAIRSSIDERWQTTGPSTRTPYP